MKIRSNAARNEMSSSYFSENESFCYDFERFIANKNGRVKGNYNAWSYLILGQITNPKKCNLTYKKSTFTSNGNLLLSPKYQCLLVLAEWEIECQKTFKSEFTIRRKTFVDSFKKHFRKSLYEPNITKNYVIEANNKIAKPILKLIEILNPLFQSREIYKIECKKNRLKIELRTEKHYFDIFEKLIAEV